MQNIRQATQNDLEELLLLYNAAVAHLHAQGIPQWSDEYPSGMVEEDIRLGELYVLEEGGVLRGSVALNARGDNWHDGVPWSEGPAHYVHRLAVDVSRPRQGYARALMAFAHTFARQQGSVWMRLDTMAYNVAAMGLYEGMGYRYVGSLDNFGDEFRCFEGALSDL